MLKLGLRSKAAIFIAAILILVIGLSTVVISSEVTRRLEGALLNSATLVGQNLVKSIKNTVDMGILLNELEGLSDQLTQAVSQNSDIGYVYVADNQDKMLYSSQGMPSGVAGQVMASDLSRTDPTAPVSSKVSSSGGGFYNISLGIVSEGSLKGYLALGLREEVVSTQLRQINLRMLFIGLVSFILATALIVVFVTRTISQPLSDLAGTAQEISSGRLVTPEVSGRGDEIGDLAGAFSVMVGELKGMIARFSDTSSRLQASSGELSTAARSLSTSFGKQMETLEKVVKSIAEMDRLSQDLSSQAQNLSDSANESASSITETTSTIAEINQNMGEINVAIENITSSILEMSATFGQLAEGADQTAHLAVETQEAVGKINDGVKNMEKMVEQSNRLNEDLRTNAQDIGSRAVKATLQGILSIREDVINSEKAMKSLNEKIESIGEIVTVIESIADQTNLLALNAAIISAQAGDEGKSFAVIAAEIRDLSASTTESTKKISSLIQAVQGEAKSYTSYVKRVSKSVEDGHNLGKQAEEALNKIVDSAGESAKMSNQISRVTKEQAAASEKVSSSIEVFTRRADDIRRATSEQAQTAKFIRDSIERAKNMVEKVYRSTDEQNKSSQLLNETVIKAEEIAGKLHQAMEKERDLTGMIAHAVDDLKTMSQQNFEMVRSVDSSSETLTGMSGALNKELQHFQENEGKA